MNALERLKQFTVVVADTGDFELLNKYKPQDATTNPSLIFAASKLSQYSHLVEDALIYAKKNSNDLAKQVELALDKLVVNFGVEILKIIPGRVSTEIDARLSFDVEGTIKKAREIIALYKQAGIDTEKRVLVKLSSTWEGLQAAQQLEKEGIHVNMTLLFSLAQAAVAAEVGATLISPFAGRITDYFKEKEKVNSYPASRDPGVLSVQQIYNYYKKFGYKTVVMGASFRSKEQVLELAGCDLLTVSPKLLEDLKNETATQVVRKLDPEKAKVQSRFEKKLYYDQKSFLWELTRDDMAYFKLGEGIRKFASDLEELEGILRKRLQSRL